MRVIPGKQLNIFSRALDFPCYFIKRSENTCTKTRIFVAD